MDCQKSDLDKQLKKSYSYFMCDESFVVSKANQNSFKFKIRGSDLSFLLKFQSDNNVTVEVITESIVDNVSMKARVFTTNTEGFITFTGSGECSGEANVTLKNKRQLSEFNKIKEHIKRSLRANSINFILED